jgi:hypothetical protein
MAIPMSILLMDFVHAWLKRQRYSNSEKFIILSNQLPHRWCIEGCSIGKPAPELKRTRWKNEI